MRSETTSGKTMYRLMLIAALVHTPLKAPAEELKASFRPTANSPRIDYGAMSATIKEIAREETPRQKLIEFESFSQAERLGRELEKGKRADCRTAYAGLGPLGIPLLIFSTITDIGCKW